MIAFESFEEGLQDTLNHLYNPAYHPPGAVCIVLGLEARAALQSVQEAVSEAIEILAPAPHVPPSARSRRIHDVLARRYLEKLTQEETAERLGITPRHLRREQTQAVNTLARLLWERHGGLLLPDADFRAEGESPEWLSQVRQELVALEKGSRGNIASVGDAITSMVELVSPLAARHGIRLTIDRIQPGLMAAIHPSKLRPVLVNSLTGLIRRMTVGSVAIHAAGTGNLVQITIAGSPAPPDEPPEDDLVRELLSDHAGAIQRLVSGNRFILTVTLPAAAKVTVLVVDDNADLLHFYRRYVQGTRYQIVPLAEGSRLFETINSVAPDVIVLDVMLPDIDGWELLAHLHNHPTTRPIPVILCSVVREEELALALGAAVYVSKPVRRQEFIQALDLALSRAPARAPEASENSGPAR